MTSVFKEVAELMAGLKHRVALTGAGISAGTYFIPAGVKHGWKTSDKSVKILDISLKQD